MTSPTGGDPAAASTYREDTGVEPPVPLTHAESARVLALVGAARDVTELRVWRLDLPYLAPPLSLNGRPHWSVKAKATRQLRDDAAVLARHARIPQLARVAVELHYVPRVVRRRDAINLAASLKPVEDGLVDARVVPDDTVEHLDPRPVVFDAVDPAPMRSRLYVVVSELSGRITNTVDVSRT